MTGCNSAEGEGNYNNVFTKAENKTEVTIGTTIKNITGKWLGCSFNFTYCFGLLFSGAPTAMSQR
jgi:hypothetical protein